MDSIIKKINDSYNNNMQIIIDNREHNIINIFNQFNFTLFSTSNLDCGDIHFISNNNIIFIIERKTIDDLAKSIKDGRLREQKIRLNKYNSNIILYLIEGSISHFYDFNNYKISGIPYSTIIGSQTNILVRDKMNIYRTNYIQESVYFILNLFHKFQIYPNQLPLFNNYDYVDIIQFKKKNNINPYNCFIFQLSQIPGCSINIAKQIAEQTKNMFNLCNLYASFDNISDKQNLLSDISYKTSNNKYRKIGPKLSAKIYNYLTNH